MTNAPSSVEIIIPTYNQSQYLGGCLSSVIAQDHTEWRATVINNFSTDDTEAVIRSFKDARIRLVNFANHGIIAASRNLALLNSDATYVAFLDSDDWWEPTKLSTCLQALQGGASLVCHGERWVFDNSVRTVTYGPERNSKYSRLLLRGNCLSTSAVVGLTQVFKDVGGFSENPKFTTAEDYDLWLRLSERGYQFQFLPDVLGSFRIHHASHSSDVERNFEAEIAVVMHHLNQFGSVHTRRVRRRKGRAHYGAGRAYQIRNEIGHSWSHLRRALMLSPGLLRAYAAIAILIVSEARKRIRTITH